MTEQQENGVACEWQDPNDVPDRLSMTHALNRAITNRARQALNRPIIGLSVSACVRDIAIGLVNIKNVVKIIAGTNAGTPDQWDEVIKYYKQSVWHHQFADEAERIIRQILADGKIIQPRVSGNRAPVLYDNKHWVDSEDEITYQRSI